MNFDKRIWKTAALAAVLTLVGGLFIMRVDDWTRGLNSGFVAYGQTGAPGSTVTLGCSSGSGATGTASVCVTKVLPQVVGGGGYTSIIEVINTGSTTAGVSASFFNPDGTASTAVYSADLNGGRSTFTGSTPAAMSVPANGILVLTLQKTGDTVVNWGMVTSTSTISVAEAFELRDQGNLLSRVGVPASAPDMTSFIIPRFRNVTTGLDVGFAVANTAATDTTLTVTLRDGSGKVLATTQIPLAKHSQIAKFPSEIFPNLSPADATGYHAMTFTAGGAQLAAIGLAIEGGSLATFPVDRLQ